MYQENRKSRLTMEFRKKIASVLETKGVPSACPMCGNERFRVADGLISHVWQKASTTTSLEGPAVICASIICDNCGFVSEHSLGVLGLLDEFDKYASQE